MRYSPEPGSLRRKEEKGQEGCLTDRAEALVAQDNVTVKSCYNGLHIGQQRFSLPGSLTRELWRPQECAVSGRGLPSLQRKKTTHAEIRTTSWAAVFLPNPRRLLRTTKIGCVFLHKD